MDDLKIKIDEFYKSKKYKDALQLLEKMEEEIPNDFEILKGKTSILGLLSRNEESVAVADMALGINNRDHELLHMKGVGLYHLGKYPEALTVFNQCLDLVPNFHRAIQKKISILLFLNRFEEAAQLYQESDLPAIDNEIPFNNLGYLYFQLGDLKKSEEFLVKAKKFNKFQPMTYYNLANIYAQKKEIGGHLKNSILFLLLKLLDFVGIGKLLFRFTPSKDFQKKKEIFDGPGKLFKTKKHEHETKAILKLLRGPNAMALCNDTWEWFSVNIPYNATDNNGFKGDIDILLKRPRRMGYYDAGFTYRGFEVKTTKVNKLGKLMSGIHRGPGKLRKLKSKLDLLKKFGCEQIFFLEIFILERDYSNNCKFPSEEISTEIERKANFLKDTGYGYVVFAEEPSASHDDETGGISHFPLNVLNTIQNETCENFKKLVNSIDLFRSSLPGSIYSTTKNQLGLVGGIVTFCPHCKRLTLLENFRFVDYHCFYCKEKIY